MMERWCEPGEAAKAYTDLIFHRATNGMIIDNWHVDWSKEPYTHSWYEDAHITAMPLPRSQDALFEGRVSSSPTFIASVLHSVYGWISMRLTINCNDPSSVYLHADGAKWGRMSASGGGRYCADFYLIESGRGEHDSLNCGIYHYTPVRHAWERLAIGDYTHYIADSQGYINTAQRYLIVTINYWRSGFKYNDFAYQATAMDVGTVIGSMSEFLGTRVHHTWDMWINEVPIAGLLGLDETRDGIYAVQGWGSSIATVPQGKIPEMAVPKRVTSCDSAVTDFVTTRALQADMHEYPQRPRDFARVQNVSLEPATRVKEDWFSSMYHRSSSFGRFTGASYGVDDLIGMLHHMDVAAESFMSALKDDTNVLHWQCLVYVFAIRGLAPGLYRYDGSGSRELTMLSGERQDDFLAGTYFLKNYDVNRSSAVCILCANIYESVTRWGVRGYRLVNALVGAQCQLMSTEAARRGLGTGAALGFDAEAHTNHACLFKDHMTPMLMMMTGVDDRHAGMFHSNATAIAEGATVRR